MARDTRLRYAITEANHRSMLKIQAFAVMDGKETPDLSMIVNMAIECLVQKMAEDLRRDGSKYHLMMAEMLEDSS